MCNIAIVYVLQRGLDPHRDRESGGKNAGRHRAGQSHPWQKNYASQGKWKSETEKCNKNTHSYMLSAQNLYWRFFSDNNNEKRLEGEILSVTLLLIHVLLLNFILKSIIDSSDIC